MVIAKDSCGVANLLGKSTLPQLVALYKANNAGQE